MEIIHNETDIKVESEKQQHVWTKASAIEMIVLRFLMQILVHERQYYNTIIFL